MLDLLRTFSWGLFSMSICIKSLCLWTVFVDARSTLSRFSGTFSLRSSETTVADGVDCLDDGRESKGSECSLVCRSLPFCRLLRIHLSECDSVALFLICPNPTCSKPCGQFRRLNSWRVTHRSKSLSEVIVSRLSYAWEKLRRLIPSFISGQLIRLWLLARG